MQVFERRSLIFLSSVAVAIFGLTFLALPPTAIGAHVDIGPREKMALRASIPTRLNNSGLLAPAIFLVCDRFDMGWIDTASHAAFMICLIVVGKGSDIRFVRDYVSAFPLTIYTNVPIPVFVESAEPKSTARIGVRRTGLFNLFLKR